MQKWKPANTSTVMMLNPLHRIGHREYLFLLQETLLDNGDSISESVLGTVEAPVEVSETLGDLESLEVEIKVPSVLQSFTGVGDLKYAS